MTRQILMYQDNIKNYHDRARQIMTNHDKIRARRFLLAPLVLRVATPGAVLCFLAGGPLLAEAGDWTSPASYSPPSLASPPRPYNT